MHIKQEIRLLTSVQQHISSVYVHIMLDYAVRRYSYSHGKSDSLDCFESLESTLSKEATHIVDSFESVHFVQILEPVFYWRVVSDSFSLTNSVRRIVRLMNFTFSPRQCIEKVYFDRWTINIELPTNGNIQFLFWYRLFYKCFYS